MTTKEKEIREILIDKAVELWITMLSKPKYDNLGKNSKEPIDSITANTLASSLANMIPKNNTPNILSKFGKALKDIMLNGYDWEYSGSKHHTNGEDIRCLSVDYHPDTALSAAAERVGLKMEFPWKTNMHFYKDSISVSYGYGAESVYYYPLNNGEWLATKLHGSDVNKIIKLVEKNILDLELENKI
jgi:hypothetical protein